MCQAHPDHHEKWTNWGRMADVDYTNTTIPAAGSFVVLGGRDLKIRPIYARRCGRFRALKNSGFDLVPSTASMGRTPKGCQEFQKKKGLKWTVSSAQAAKALLGCWVDGGNNHGPTAGFDELGGCWSHRPHGGEDVTDVQYRWRTHNFSPGPSTAYTARKPKAPSKGSSGKRS